MTDPLTLKRLAVRIETLQRANKHGWHPADEMEFRQKLPGGRGRFALPDPKWLREVAGRTGTAFTDPRHEDSGKDEVESRDLRLWNGIVMDLEGLMHRNDPKNPKRQMRDMARGRGFRGSGAEESQVMESQVMDGVAEEMMKLARDLTAGQDPTKIADLKKAVLSSVRKVMKKHGFGRPDASTQGDRGRKLLHITSGDPDKFFLRFTFIIEDGKVEGNIYMEDMINRRLRQVSVGSIRDILSSMDRVIGNQLEVFRKERAGRAGKPTAGSVKNILKAIGVPMAKELKALQEGRGGHMVLYLNVQGGRLQQMSKSLQGDAGVYVEFWDKSGSRGKSVKISIHQTDDDGLNNRQLSTWSLTPANGVTIDEIVKDLVDWVERTIRKV